MTAEKVNADDTLQRSAAIPKELSFGETGTLSIKGEE
jgi:hypothetical protein